MLMHEDVFHREPTAAQANKFEFGEDISNRRYTIAFLYPKYQTEKDPKIRNLMLKVFKLFTLVDGTFPFYPKGWGRGKRFTSYTVANEAELVECGRSVSVHRNQEAFEEKQYLSQNYRNLTFFLSNAILSETEYLSVSEDGADYMKRQGQYYLQAELQQAFLKVKFNLARIRRYLRFTKNHSAGFRQTVKPLSVFGCVQTVFYIYGFFATVTVVVFGIEGSGFLFR